ncbi:MAG: sulfite exporter TauE/SafE family protein [Candidatus Freyarchaeum deiterrae]
MDWWLLYLLLNSGSNWWLYPLLGGTSFFTGIIGPMFGIGGGFLNVPAIQYVANEPINVAIGTSLFIIVFTSSSGTVEYARKRVIDYKLGLVLAVASVPGGFLGAYLTGWVPGNILEAIFGVALVVVGINMLFRSGGRRSNPNSPQEAVKEEKKIIKRGILSWKRTIKVANGESYEYFVNVPLGLAFSFVAGLVSGLLGIGGGIVQVPVLNIALGVPMIVSVATSVFIIIFTSLVGSFEHVMLGQVNWQIGIVMMIGAVIGAQIGVRIAMRISPNLLRKIFGLVLILISVQMIYEAIIAFG